MQFPSLFSRFTRFAGRLGRSFQGSARPADAAALARTAIAHSLPVRSMLVLVCTLALAAIAAAAQQDISGTIDNVRFGATVASLPNGNIVVVDPAGPRPLRAGAVYLYRPDGSLISTLTGSTTNDKIGSGGIVLVGGSHFVILSPSWANGGQAKAGAATWVDGDTGLEGTVSASNSLVGTTANDQVGSGGVTLVGNRNYLVVSTTWNGKAGAVTWGNGDTGVAGVVSAANSLVGSTANDQIASGYDLPPRRGVIVLGNGNYVINSPHWTSNGANGLHAGLGAVTFGDGATGVAGVVSADNSLVGSAQGDQVGAGGVTALANGNYVVASPSWTTLSPPADNLDSGIGAVTWGSGTVGIAGTISAGNSLVGSAAGDLVGGGSLVVGGGGVTALSNGHYVVNSPSWNGAGIHVGASTWADGTTGITGAVSTGNSLVGTANDDAVGYTAVALTNGNYVVLSNYWNAWRGAATWANGATGVVGTVGAGNSLVGTVSYDMIATRGVALADGNYVVGSQNWNAQAGAVTWGDGSAGVTGEISAANSLIGTTSGDNVGAAITALANGNYVAASAAWNGYLGAVSWGNGAAGTTGAVSASNSLVGTLPFDLIGEGGVVALTNGNYVVVSPGWAGNVGAVTWGDGAAGVSGAVSAGNSLVGSVENDQIGVPVTGRGVIALSNGNYIVASPHWNNDTGAATWGNGQFGAAGVVSADNSLIGVVPGSDQVASGDTLAHTYGGVAGFDDGYYVVASPGHEQGRGAITLANGAFGLNGTIKGWNSVIGRAFYADPSAYVYDAALHRLVVGRPLDAVVSIFTEEQIFADNFER